jgi:hypothetical protein
MEKGPPAGDAVSACKAAPFGSDPESRSHPFSSVKQAKATVARGGLERA